MQLHSLEKLELQSPLWILADDQDDAANLFYSAWSLAFGCFPAASYEVTQWSPPWSKNTAPLWRFLNNGEKGFVWEGRNRWEFHNPFENW